MARPPVGTVERALFNEVQPSMVTGRAHQLSGRQKDSQTEREEFLFELRELAALSRRRAHWIGVAMALCISGALAFIAVRAPLFTSTAQIMLDPRSLNVLQDDVVPRSSSADVDDAVIGTEIGLLTSDDVLTSVVETCQLQDDPEFARRPGLLAQLAVAIGLHGTSGDLVAVQDAAVAELRRRLVVSREGKSFLVNIAVRAGSPAKAARIATATIEAFLADLVKRRRDIVTHAQGAMSATLAGQRDRVTAAETAVERYKASNGIVDIDGRALNTARVAELSSQLIAARNAATALKARLTQIILLRGSPDHAQEFESTLLTQLRTNRVDIARQQADLRATLGPRHPQVQQINAQLQALDGAVGREVDRLYAAARSDYQGAVARAQAIDHDLHQLESRVTNSNATLVDLHELEREAEAQRSVYEKFMGRDRELREQETISAVNATVVAEPKLSPTPTGLQPAVLIAAALAMGLLLGTGGAWAFEQASDRIYSAGRLGSKTGLPMLGVLPMVIPPGSTKAVLACALAPGRGTATSRTLFRVSEAFERNAGSTSSSLLVLSASEGSVGTVVASNVVLAAAQQGHLAMLVDVASRTADAFPIQTTATPGADDSLACDVEGFPRFAIAQMRNGESAATKEERRRRWSATFERIIFDVGWGADESTVRKLVAASSSIVIVAEAEVSTFTEIDDLRSMLAGHEAKILGTVLVEPGQDSVVPLRTKTSPFQFAIARSPGFRTARA